MPELAPATLAAAAGDDAAMAALRVSALALADGNDWARCDDHEVIVQLAAAQAQGRLATHAPPAARLYRLAPVPAPGAAPAPAPAPASSPRAAPASASSSAAAETTFSAALDTAAMVAVLQQAAQDGVPFCEECARAAAARQQAAA